MSSNVVQLAFDEPDEADEKEAKRQLIENKILELNDWLEKQGIDIYTIEHKHQMAVIMAQFQVMLLGV